MRPVSIVLLWGALTASLAEQPADPLPQPHYAQMESDPPWLSTVAQFHGPSAPGALQELDLAWPDCEPSRPQAISTLK
jgi:hypothetical protein